MPAAPRVPGPVRVLLVPDGMADEPRPELGGRTPLEAARTPALDSLARRGTLGLVRTVPRGMKPGSDVANLAVLGYDPAAVFSGRSPLEAANIGVELGPHDVTYRCNFVTIEAGVMKDNTAGHIGVEEGRRLVAALQAALGGGPFEFHAGVSYRNLLLWRGGQLVPCTPPHDILDQPVRGYLPGAASGDGQSAAALRLAELQRLADEVLARQRSGTHAWFWGEGTAPSMPRFSELYGLRGAVVGAVDLVRGIGRYAGFDVLDVPGATGDLDTDYAAKARAAVAALDEYDLVWVHVEAPDEAAHMGDVAEKVRAIERVDAEVLAPLLAATRRPAVLVLPDHATPVRTRTHDDSPVPFAFAPGAAIQPGERVGEAATAPAYSEAAAAASGLMLEDGPALMRLYLSATG